MSATLTQEPPVITDGMREEFATNGFLKIKNVISKEEANHYREQALKITNTTKGVINDKMDVFHQIVNVWQEDSLLKALTLHKSVTGLVKQLAQRPMRLWHDHLLVKKPHHAPPTFFHQDKPYWPHSKEHKMAFSIWIALQDVPQERGCMSFIPGSHKIENLDKQNLNDGNDLFNKCPELKWERKVTVPLRAGDCTIHHAYTAHMAHPNNTAEFRVAHIAIFMDADTRYVNKPHVVTDGINTLVDGDILDNELFPEI